MYARPPEITPILSIPVNMAIGGMNRSMTTAFGCSETLLPIMMPSISEPARPANIMATGSGCPADIHTYKVHPCKDSDNLTFKL
jgi:hypothetical protein